MGTSSIRDAPLAAFLSTNQRSSFFRCSSNRRESNMFGAANSFQELRQLEFVPLNPQFLRRILPMRRERSAAPEHDGDDGEVSGAAARASGACA
jgi:hypothetical protein